MNRLLVFMSLILASLSYGQTVKVDGTITADSSSISLGQVAIYSQSDSLLIKGTYLDSAYFETLIKTKGETDFYAKIKVPGYSDTIVNFKVTDSVVHLGVVSMVKNLAFDAVEVVYVKPMFKRTMDGISVNVDGTSLENLTNLFEVLKASPKITSPDDETIEIIGRGSPLILVDRQAIISNDELKAIPANQIEKIEIITNPSAKYKAQGSSNGVIEVYTKNFHLEGYNASVSVAGGVNTQLKPTARVGLGISLKKKKFSLNGYLGGNYDESNGFGTGVGFTTDESNRGLKSEFSNDRNGRWNYYNIKSAYNISEKQRLTAGVNGNGSGGTTWSESVSQYYSGDDLITDSKSDNVSSYVWASNSAFLNYTLETDTSNSVLEVNVNYVNRKSTTDGTFLNSYEFVPTNDLSKFEVMNNSRNIPNVGEARVNYEHHFDTTGWKLEVGASYSALFNNQRFDRSNLIGGNWVVDGDFSNSYDYQEHIGGVFTEVSKKWKKFGFRAGIRGEYTRLDGYSNSLNQQFIDSTFFLPFPTASIMYEPKEKLAITVFYKTGIERPQFSNYDPFIRIEDSLSVEYGNPFLRPALEQTIGVDFDIAYAYSISLTYNFVKDPTSTISFVDDETFLTESTPWNADSEQSVGASLNLPFQKKWLQGWNSIWLNYSKYDFSPIFGREPFFNLTYGVYSYLTFTLKKGVSIMNRLHINKWGSATNENNARINWGLRLTKKFTNNNIQLFADISNIIPPKSKRTEFSGNFEYQTNGQYQFTAFKLGLYIKFGRLKAADQIKESSSEQSGRL